MRRIDLKKASVARPNTIRDINRQIVLNYVRERGPISRAEIAQETALQRSTVSLIVDELKGGGLIEEVSGESRGGRPPILLSLRTADAVAVGVDLGTISTIVATSDLAGRVLEQEEFPTDPDARKTMSRLVECVRGLARRSGGTVEGVGVSLPGLVDQETGTATFIPHFKWRDWEVAKELGEALGLGVHVDNDANAAALAELWFGRPEIREVRDFIIVLVEEGVGTGIVFDGQVYRGQSGAAGEFGHMTIGQGAPVACAAGSRGCWEAFSSQRAALARYEQSGAAAKVDFKQLVDLALEDDAAAREALRETAHYLGVGIANLTQGLAPEAVIVGDIKAAVGEGICRGLPPAQIIASTLGEQPTLMGALSLVLTTKFTHVALS